MVAHMVAITMADIEVHMVANMVADMVANMVANMVAVILSDFHSVNISELTKLFWAKVFFQAFVSPNFFKSKLTPTSKLF